MLRKTALNRRTRYIFNCWSAATGNLYNFIHEQSVQLGGRRSVLPLLTSGVALQLGVSRQEKIRNEGKTSGQWSYLLSPLSDSWKGNFRLQHRDKGTLWIRGYIDLWPFRSSHWYDFRAASTLESPDSPIIRSILSILPSLPVFRTLSNNVLVRVFRIG